MKKNKLKIGSKSIIVFLAIALILSGVVMVIYDPDRVFTAEVPVFAGAESDGAKADGVVSVETILRAPDGSIIRRYDPTQALSGALLDSATNEVIQSYTVRVSWNAVGDNINWDSLIFTGSFVYDRYVGLGFYGQGKDVVKNIEIGSHSKNVNATGFQDYIVADLDSLMPDTVPDFEWTENEDGTTSRHGVSVQQKTAEPHSVIYVFEGDFKLSVHDMFGNLYESPLTLDVELKLLWPGSTFSNQWNNENQPPPDTAPPSYPAAPASAKADPEYEARTTVDPNPQNYESDEFVHFDSGTRTSTSTASIFGGGPTEDIGVGLIALGGGLLIAVFLMPNTFKRRK